MSERRLMLSWAMVGAPRLRRRLGKVWRIRDEYFFAAGGDEYGPFKSTGELRNAAELVAEADAASGADFGDPWHAIQEVGE